MCDLHKQVMFLAFCPGSRDVPRAQNQSFWLDILYKPCTLRGSCSAMPKNIKSLTLSVHNFLIDFSNTQNPLKPCRIFCLFVNIYNKTSKTLNQGKIFCFIPLRTDLEKVVNCPQAENSELYNVLKLAWFATMDEQMYMY